MPPKIPQPEPEPEPEVSLGGNTNKKTDKPKDDLSHGAFRDAASIASICAPCLRRLDASADAAYAKFAMKGNKEHPLVSLLVFVVGTLVGVVPLIVFAKKLMAPIPGAE